MTAEWRRHLRAASLIGLTIFLSSCASAPPTPKADLPLLVDPRLGFEGPSSPAVDKKLAAAWQKLSSGELETADKSLASLATRYPQYAPATLGRAVVALANDQLELAERYVEKVADPGSAYFAAEAYRGEIAMARGLTEDAYRNYARISSLPGAPTIVTTRLESVADAWFEELVARAAATDDLNERIELLSEAVAVRPRADTSRIGLARALVETKDWSRARAEVDTLLDRGLVDNPDVQAVLADLEAADGRYQDAIVRLERLVRRYPGMGHEARLSEVKLAYMRANLPPRYHRAVAAAALTRADLAVLAYWHVSAVRFASISEPPIAVDIAGEPGRDEIVKALGLGLFSVDPATRAFGPEVTVTARAFTAFAGRMMRLGPLPECAAGRIGNDVLGACGVDLSVMSQNPSGGISGSAAITVLETIDDLLSSTK